MFALELQPISFDNSPF